MAVTPLLLLSTVLIIPLALLLALPREPQLLVDPPGPDPAPIACSTSPSETAAVERLSRLIQFVTVSNGSATDLVQHPEEFDAMLTYLEATYPAFWAKVEVESTGPGGYSRLLTWRGSDPSLQPALFVSHYDVVPAPAEGWRHPPFSGAVADGFIWGRGTLDIKFAVSAILEGATSLAQSGYQPVRTLMFHFGANEEVGGHGARAAAALLTSRGVRLEVVVDEGGAIMWEGLEPLTSSPVAFVAVSEKGFEQLEVVFKSGGGHSSMPPLDGSDVASQVARFVAQLQGHPPAPQLLAPVAGMLQALGFVTPRWYLQPLLLRANSWPLDWLFARVLLYLGPEKAALARSSVAVTWMTVGVADNVLPQRGKISINLRPMPGWSQQDMIQYLERLAKAARADVTVTPSPVDNRSPAAAATPATGPYFRLLKQAIQELWQQDGKAITVSPGLQTGMTDSRHFASLSDHGVLRFVPYGLKKSAGDLYRVHGIDERVPVEHYQRAICTYTRLLELFGSAVGGAGGTADATAATDSAHHRL